MAEFSEMSTINDTNFYATLPEITDFFNASNSEHYTPLPESWYVAVSDIVNSTEAISKDRYKTVNILGASPIVGILNIAGQHSIPYTFGGDGATFCIPPDLYEQAKKILGESRNIGKKEYGLDLRIALIPISYIRQQGYNIYVAKYRASDHYTQAIFTGGGISFAENVLKKSDIQDFDIPDNDQKEVDFTGLECRWQEVRQPGKEVITMLVKSNSMLKNEQQIYEKVLQQMRAIFGFDDKTNPIDASQLQMNLSFSELWGEAKFRTSGDGWFKRLGYVLRVQLQTIIGKVLMGLNIQTSATDWSLYKTDLSLNSDHRKFDDMLRVVISGTADQRKELEAFLDQLYQQQQLAYGIHVTDAAMITCMVFQYHQEHIHFVDGSGGGYVEASKDLKTRMKVFTSN